jgi:hypothetical protein
MSFELYRQTLMGDCLCEALEEQVNAGNIFRFGLADLRGVLGWFVIFPPERPAIYIQFSLQPIGKITHELAVTVLKQFDKVWCKAEA